jgi:uncharacterized protein YlxP (DUF503 family)
MVVSMIQFIIELPEVHSIKDKRRIVKSLKDRIQQRFKVSIAEVDLQDSLRFAQIGAALVSNSKRFGESVMHKILGYAEENAPGRLADAKIMTEQY